MLVLSNSDWTRFNSSTMQDNIKNSILDTDNESANSCSAVICKMVAHISAFVLPSIIIYHAIAVAELSLFTLHPILTVLGCSLLMFEGIVIFSKDSSLFPSMNRKTKASIHYWLVGIGVGCVVSGLAAIHILKESKGKNHYTTWHGLIGVITVGYLSAQSLGGAILKYHKYLSGVIKLKLMDLKLYHATSGLLAYLLVTITLITSMQSNWANRHIPWYFWYICMACISASALVVTTHVTSTYLPQTMKKSPGVKG